MTADDFREMALAMPGAVEMAHMGHPDFRANGRIFATLHDDDRTATVMITPDEQQELMREHPSTFVPASGAWGRQGSTNVRLGAADVAAVRGAIGLAWQRIVDRPARRPARKPPGRPSPRRR